MMGRQVGISEEGEDSGSTPHHPPKHGRAPRSAWRFRIVLATTALLVVPLGILTKSYSGPAESWVRGSLGGVLYEVLWVLLICAALPKLAVWRVATVVFLGTGVLEFLQLWHPVFLERARSTFLGAMLLGSSFAWLDLFHYVVGCLLAAVYVRSVHRASA